jgi:membrane protein YqaA with SNARE-associated domain
MGKQAEEEVRTGTGRENCSPEKPPRKSSKRAYIFGILGIVLTLLMAAAILVFPDEVREMQKLGYLGAFIVSIPAGATVIIPVPAIAIVLALGGVMPFPWLVGLAAALGETVGALTIYMTGHGTSRAISESKHGRIQRIYDKMLELIERRGAITLFAVTSVVNPFFLSRCVCLRRAALRPAKISLYRPHRQDNKVHDRSIFRLLRDQLAIPVFRH